MKMKYMIGVAFFAYHLIVSFAQQSCSGTLSGTFAGIVVNNGASCTLNDATVTGSVTVNAGATLTTTGATAILGSIETFDSDNVLLSGSTTVSGSINFSSASSIIEIDSQAVVTSVFLDNSGGVILRGSTGVIESKSSGMVNIDGGQITGGGLLVEHGTGAVTLCGANVTGGISFTERTGNFVAVAGSGCAASAITGSLVVEKGVGDVQVTGATLSSSDLSIVEQTGAVQISSTMLSDIAVGKSSGDVVLDDVTTDSDVGLIENGGSVEIRDCTFQGDVMVESNAAVTVSGCSFGLEDVSFKLNSGPVEFIANSDVSVSFEENDSVEIRDSTIVDASVTKNTGGVSINGNSFSTLSCADNSPAPTGSANTVSELADGQCSQF